MRVGACANHIEPCIKSSSPRSNATSTLFNAPTRPSVGTLVSFNTHLHFHLVSSHLISSHLISSHLISSHPDFLHTYPEPFKPSPSCSVSAAHESMAEDPFMAWHALSQHKPSVQTTLPYTIADGPWGFCILPCLESFESWKCPVWLAVRLLF